MSDSEVRQTIDALSNDNVPDIFEILYFSLCLYRDHELTCAIVKQKGAPWLHERLEHKFSIWIPHYFEGLDSGRFRFPDDPNSDMAIIIRMVFERFPDLKPLVPQRYSDLVPRAV